MAGAATSVWRWAGLDRGRRPPRCRKGRLTACECSTMTIGGRRRRAGSGAWGLACGAARARLSSRARSRDVAQHHQHRPGASLLGRHRNRGGLDGAAGAGERRQRQLDRALLAAGDATDEVGAAFRCRAGPTSAWNALRSTWRGSTAPTRSRATGFIGEDRRRRPRRRTTQAGSRSTSVAQPRFRAAQRLELARLLVTRAAWRRAAAAAGPSSPASSPGIPRRCRRRS